MPLNRRLAAVLIADVAGYSRLIGAYEEQTLGPSWRDPVGGDRADDRCEPRPTGQDQG